jgi:hypothetical protein
VGRGRRGSPSPSRRAAMGDGVSDTGGIEARPDVDADVSVAHHICGQRAGGQYAGGADVDVSESREARAAEQASTTAAGNCIASALTSAAQVNTISGPENTTAWYCGPRRTRGMRLRRRMHRCKAAGIRKQGQICEEGPGRIPVNVRSQKESRYLERTTSTRNDARCGHNIKRTISFVERIEGRAATRRQTPTENPKAVDAALQRWERSSNYTRLDSTLVLGFCARRRRNVVIW